MNWVLYKAKKKEFKTCWIIPELEIQYACGQRESDNLIKTIDVAMTISNQIYSENISS